MWAFANARNFVNTEFLNVGQGGGALKIRGSELLTFLAPASDAAEPNKVRENKVSLDAIFHSQFVRSHPPGPTRSVYGKKIFQA
jgi:hypothetical protein